MQFLQAQDHQGYGESFFQGILRDHCREMSLTFLYNQEKYDLRYHLQYHSTHLSTHMSSHRHCLQVSSVKYICHVHYRLPVQLLDIEYQLLNALWDLRNLCQCKTHHKGRFWLIQGTFHAQNTKYQ